MDKLTGAATHMIKPMQQACSVNQHHALAHTLDLHVPTFMYTVHIYVRLQLQHMSLPMPAIQAGWNGHNCRMVQLQFIQGCQGPTGTCSRMGNQIGFMMMGSS